MHFGDLMSSIDDPVYAEGGLANAGRSAYSVAVPARTLSEVLDEADLNGVDVMVLDLEGHEIEALSGLDMERHAPRFLMLEFVGDQCDARAQFDPVLKSHFSFRESLSDYDVLYERRD
jgi:hypothetical protein